MGIIQRQSIKGTAVYIIGAGFHFITLLLLLPNLLTEQDASLYRVYASLVLMCSVFGLGGISALLLKCVPEFNSDKQKLKTFNLVTLLYTLVAASAMVVGLYVCKHFIYQWKGTSNPYLLTYFWCVPLASFCFALLYYFEYYSIATHRLTAPSVVKEILLRLSMLVLMVLYYYKIISINTFFLAYALSYAAGLLVLLGYCIIVRGYRIGYSKVAMLAIPWRQHIPYLLFIFSIGVLGSLILNSDQLVIYGMQGSTAVNIYGYAVTAASMITIPYKPLSNILLPFIYDAWHTNDTEKLNKINQDSSTTLTTIGVLLFLLLASNVHHMYPFVPEQFRFFKWPVVIIGVGRVLDYLTGVSTEMLITSPSHKRMAWYMLLTFAFSLLCYKILIPTYGVIGTAWSCSITLVFFNCLKYYRLLKAHQLQALSRKSFYVVGIGAVLFAAQHFTPQCGNMWLDIFLRSAALTILFVAVVIKCKWLPMVNEWLAARRERVE